MTKRSFAWRQRQGFAVEAREPVKSVYYRELWNDGPIRKEARRLARLDLRKVLVKRGDDIDHYSEQSIQGRITSLILTSEDVYLKRAKWNLGE